MHGNCLLKTSPSPMLPMKLAFLVKHILPTSSSGMLVSRLVPIARQQDFTSLRLQKSLY